MTMPRTPESIASSSRHVWTSALPVIVAIRDVPVEPDCIRLNIPKQCITFNGATIRLPKAQFSILTAVACAGRYLGVKEIAQIVWGDDEGGGPDAWDITIRTQISVIRRAVASIGIGISSRHSWGYRVCRLEDQQRAGRLARVSEAA